MRQPREMSVMETVLLDGSCWKSRVDFYNALLCALKPLDGHGHNINAFIDSMIYGGMLETKPPYEVLVHNVASPEVRHDVETLSCALAEARKELQERRGKEVEVTLRLVSV
jgi:hypothetical protein